MGEHDDEMYIRWLQYGVFSPIMRLHSTNWEFLGKEPWNFSWEAEVLSTEYLRLRHKLIPYIYSMNYRSYKEGRALCEPMYYEYKNEESYHCPNEYMFGSELLVCPVTTKLDDKTKTATTKLWLPDGRWTNVFDGKIYKGGQWALINSPINTIPVLAKEGAVIPMSDDKGNSWKCPEKLKFLVYRGSGTFKFYEDDGETQNYKNGEFSESTMTVREKGDTLEFTVSGGKKLPCIPLNRTYTVVFKDVKSFDGATVTVNGKASDFKTYGNTVTIENVNADDEIKVTLSKVTVCKNKPLDERILDCVIHLNASNTKKKLLHSKTESCKKKEDYETLIRRTRAKSLRYNFEEQVRSME